MGVDFKQQDLSIKSSFQKAEAELSMIQRKGHLLKRSLLYYNYPPAARQTRIEQHIAKRHREAAKGQHPTADGIESQFKLTGAMYTVQGIHDSLKAYYDVALSRFIDNVSIQVIQRHLLKEGVPFRLFSYDFVNDLTDEELDRLVGEDKVTKEERKKLEVRLLRLSMQSPGQPHLHRSGFQFSFCSCSKNLFAI